MAQIKKLTVADAPLEMWQPDGVDVHEGTPNGHGHVLYETEAPTPFGTGVFACQPSKTSYPLTSNEIIYVIEGSVSIGLDDAEPIHLSKGDLALLPKGHISHWEFHEPFKEVWILI